MGIEYPPILTGTPEEQIRQIHEYLCRLADILRTIDSAESLLRLDTGTGVALGDQFPALQNKIEGGQDRKN